MKMKNKLYFLATMLLSVSAYAQADHNGNGGSGVICTENGSTKVEVLDYFNAVDAEGWKLDVPGVNEDEKVRNLIGRVEARDAGMGAELRRLYGLWSTEMNTMIRSEIPGINDTRLIVRSKERYNCYRIQIAVQRSHVRPREKRYLIDNDYWSMMDATQRAGLIFHELVYRLEIPKYEENKAFSDGVIYYNGLVSSTEFATLSPREYLDVFQHSLRNDFSTYDHGQYRVLSNSAVIAGDFMKGITKQTYPMVINLEGRGFTLPLTGRIHTMGEGLLAGDLAVTTTIQLQGKDIDLPPTGRADLGVRKLAEINAYRLPLETTYFKQGPWKVSDRGEPVKTLGSPYVITDYRTEAWPTLVRSSDGAIIPYDVQFLHE